MSTLIDIQNYIKSEHEEIEHPCAETQYYLTRFAVNLNKKWFISWNWSAFLIPLSWFAYRKMYLHSLSYYVSVYMVFFMACFFVGIIGSLAGFITETTILDTATTTLGYLFVELIMRTLLGLYGNSIYLNNLKRRVHSKSKLRGTSDLAVFLVIGFNITATILASLLL